MHGKKKSATINSRCTGVHPHLSTVTAAEVLMAGKGGRAALTWPRGREETPCGKESQAWLVPGKCKCLAAPVHLTEGLLVGLPGFPGTGGRG